MKINLLSLIISLSNQRLVNCKEQISLNLEELPFEIKELKLEKNLPNIVKPTIKRGNLKDAIDMFFYSDGAYCSIEGVRRWDCDNCIKRKDLKLDEVEEIANKEDSEWGYLGVSKGRLILCFRGMVTLQSTLHVANSPKTLFITREGSKAWVQSGFMQAAQVILPRVKKTLQEFQFKYPNLELFITGHSLGGALANLISVLLESEGLIEWSKTNIYTYGQPRVGDKAYANYVDARTGATLLRVVNKLDPYSNYPSRVLGYAHNQYLLLLDNDDRSINCDSHEIESQCYAFINPLDLKQHSHYFGLEMSTNCATVNSKVMEFINPISPLIELPSKLNI